MTADVLGGIADVCFGVALYLVAMRLDKLEKLVGREKRK